MEIPAEGGGAVIGGGDRMHRVAHVLFELGCLEWLTAGAVVLIIAYQLLIPPAIGLADNGDYSRVMGPLGLQYTATSRDERYFNYFNPKYKFESTTQWDGLVSSETAVVACAIAVNSIGPKTGLFDLRVVGCVHLALFLLAVCLLLRLSANLNRAARVAVSFLLLFVFCDVGYVAYFNSLYGEPASFVFLFLVLAAALRLAAQPTSSARLGVWLAVSFLFLTAKPQNSFLGILLAGYGFWIASRKISGARKLVLVGCSVALCLVSLAYHWSLPKRIMKEYLYNAVFFELLSYSPTPQYDLQQLGLNPELAEYSDTNISSPGIPLKEPQFEAMFFDRIGVGKLAAFYLRHPSRLVGVLQRTATEAFSLRPSYLGNFEKAYGLPPRAQSQAFQFWSRLKQAASPKSPWFLCVFFVGNAALALVIYLRTGSHTLKALMVLHLVVILMAVEQLLGAEIGCGQYELVKHLFLFNLLFDLCLCADVVLAASRLARPAHAGS